jgi:hypothetical protein
MRRAIAAILIGAAVLFGGVLSGIHSPAAHGQAQNFGGSSGGQTASISNGLWVPAGYIFWTQATGDFSSSLSITSNYTMTLPNGQTSVIGWTATYAAQPPAGCGSGFVVPVSGWLSTVRMSNQTTGIANGQVWLNPYILSTMPTGGNSSNSVCALTNSTSTIVANLAGGYANSEYDVTWQYGQGPGNSTSGPGEPGVISVANPSAGSQVVINSTQLNPGQRFRIIAVSCDLVTSATAANRVVVMNYVAAGNTIQLVGSPTAQVASTTMRYIFSTGIGANTSAGTGTTPATIFTLPIPQYLDVFNAGASNQIQVNAFNLQAADQFQNCTLAKTSWHEND